MVAERRDYGPVQLAEYLRQFHPWVNIDRAWDLGLMPLPDRRGGRGRWSAAIAEDLRVRWPEIAAASRCISGPGLAERGWRPSMIRDLLGSPDLHVPNPHSSRAADMRLWRLQRVEAAESTAEFIRRRELADRHAPARRRGAAQAVESKRIWKALGG